MLRYKLVGATLLAIGIPASGSADVQEPSGAVSDGIATSSPARGARSQGPSVQRGDIRIRRELSGPGAMRLLERAKAEAAAREVDVSIAVVDRDGQLLALIRMGNAAPLTITNAIAKASTAAQVGMPSGQLETLLNDGRPSYLAIQDVVPLQGGMPVFFEGELVGGIGCSGADPSTDEAIAASASTL